MKIRNIQKEDLVDVLKIENLCFQHPYSEALFLAYYERQPRGFFVAEEDEKVVGYALNDYHERELMSIAIFPEHQRKGIGTKLLKDSLKFFKRGKVRLHVRENNHLARRFYKKHGFAEVKLHKDYYTDEDGIQMEKNL